MQKTNFPDWSHVDKDKFEHLFSCFFCLLDGFAGWRWFDWALENPPFETECEIMARARLNAAPTDKVVDVDVVVVNEDIEEVDE